MTLQRFTLLPCLTSILLVSACDLGEKSIGNETDADGGDGDGDGDGEVPGDTGCGEKTVTEITDHDAALPEFDGTVADYLAIAEGVYLGDFTWAANDGPVTNVHANTSSPLTLSVTYEGGDVRLTESPLAGEFPNGQLGGFPCTNTLEIDVTLGFATEDGLFAESMVVPLSVDSHGDSSLPGLYESLDLDALQGELSSDDFTYEGGEITDYVLTASFGDGAVSGGLNMEVQFMDWVGFGSVADFVAERQP